MSHFKSFAVAGAGNIGSYLIEGLLHYKNAGAIGSVSVLTRVGSSAKIPSQANHLQVDYNSQSSLVDALKGIDVVICTFGHTALSVQYPLAQAAKVAGVRLFVPSEFGNPTSDQEERADAIGGKAKLHLRLKEIDLPYTLFFTGPWPEFCLTPAFGWDLANGKVTINGSGDAPISHTARSDVVRFISHVLVTLSPEELKNRTFRLEGQRASFNEIVRQYEAKSGKPLQITRRSREELEAAVKADSHDFISYLLLLWDNGEGVVGGGEDSATRVWPEWEPKKVVDVLLDEQH